MGVRDDGREEEKHMMHKRNIYWLPLTCPQPGTWLATQACALTRNQTCNLSVCGVMPNPLSHTSQGNNLLILTAPVQF